MSEKMPQTERQFIAQNPNQGPNKRVLFICTGGILRSATAAVIFSQPPYNFNTRACGTAEFALIRVDPVLLGWADQIVCMEEKHRVAIEKLDIASQTHYPKGSMPPIFVLEIPDIYDYREAELIARLKRSYDAIVQHLKET